MKGLKNVKAHTANSSSGSLSVNFLSLTSKASNLSKTGTPSAQHKDKISKEAAGYKAQTIDSQHCSVCTMFREPSSCTLVKGAVRPGGWCKYFERKTLGKVSDMETQTEHKEFKLFMPFGKAEKQKDGSVVVQGYASTPSPDSDGEVVTLKAVKSALPSYMAWGNIREMHRLSAVGTAKDAKVDENGLFLTARIVDKDAVKKVEEGVYKGFSIGGRKLAKVGDTITEIDMNEISIVDRPANPDCRFAIAKSFKKLNGEPGFLVKAEKPKDKKILNALAKATEALALASNPSPKDEEMQNNKVGGMPAASAATSPSISLAQKRDVSTDERKDLASEGKANPDGSFPIANKEDLKNAIKLRGHGNKKKNEKLIRRRAKELGAEDMLPDDMKAKAAKKMAKKQAKKAARAERLQKAQKHVETNFSLNSAGPSFLALSAEGVDRAQGNVSPRHDGSDIGLAMPQEGGALTKIDGSFLDLKKGMSTVGSLSYVFDSLRNAQRCLLSEAKREGGDMKDKALAKQLASAAQTVASVISQKASHEGSEALDLSDADDQYLTSTLGEDFAMSKSVVTEDQVDLNDPLIKAIIGTLAKARQPSKKELVAKAFGNLKKLNKARKDAKSAISEAHEMMKARYLAKLAKAAKKDPKDDGDEDDNGQAVMEKLQKAYNAVNNIGMFRKAVVNDLSKAVGSPGQEATDGNAFFEVPSGVKSLSQSELANAGPGGKEKGSAPFEIVLDQGAVAGKAAGLGDLQKYVKNGSVPVEVLELVQKAAKLEGENEALRNLPRSNGRRPLSFDLNKVMGVADGANNPDAANDREVLFKGVDVTQIRPDGTGSEESHKVELGKAIGNYILNPNRFAKSVMDPAFHGSAGG